MISIFIYFFFFFPPSIHLRYVHASVSAPGRDRISEYSVFKRPSRRVNLLARQSSACFTRARGRTHVHRSRITNNFFFVSRRPCRTSCTSRTVRGLHDDRLDDARVCAPFPELLRPFHTVFASVRFAERASVPRRRRTRPDDGKSAEQRSSFVPRPSKYDRTRAVCVC